MLALGARDRDPRDASRRARSAASLTSGQRSPSRSARPSSPPKAAAHIGRATAEKRLQHRSRLRSRGRQRRCRRRRRCASARRGRGARSPAPARSRADPSTPRDLAARRAAGDRDAHALGCDFERRPHQRHLEAGGRLADCRRRCWRRAAPPDRAAPDTGMPKRWPPWRPRSCTVVCSPAGSP